MKIAAIIQARTGSTRLPSKVLMKLEDKTVLEHVVERVSQSKQVQDVIVATTINRNDNPIEDLCNKKGYLLFRGSEEDVLSRYYHAACKYEVDAILRITSDCPLIDPLIIDQLVELFLDSSYEIYSNFGKELSDRTYPRGLDAEVFTFKALKDAYENSRERYHREHVTQYIYEHAKEVGILKQKENNSNIRITLDTDDDWSLISKIYRELYHGKHNFYLNEIVELLNVHPKWKLLNAHIEQKKIKE